jgi:hypothetical protein
MDCKHVNDNLVDYLYQELDADELERMEDHLRQCEGCASELKAFESTRQLMGQLPQLEPSSAVTDRLLKEAARAIQPEETVGFWDRVRAGLRMLVVHPAMTAAVALVLVLGVSFYAYRHTSPPTRGGATPIEDLPEVEPALRPAPTGEPAPPPAATAAADDLKQREQKDVARGDLAEVQHKVALREPAAQAEPPVDKPVEVTGTRGRAQTVAKARPVRRKARRHRAARPTKPTPRPRRKPKATYARKAPRKEAVLTPSPSASPPPSTPLLDSFASGGSSKNDDEDSSKKLAPKRALGVASGKTKAEKGPSYAYWLLRARKSVKTGRYEQALRMYHKALELSPQLRRTVGPEVQHCARQVARKDANKLSKIQQQLPLLAGWLEAEMATARRRARKKAQKPAAKPAKRATSRKKKAPASNAQQKAAE